MQVYFRVGRSNLESGYMDNAESLSEALSFLESVKKDSSLELVEVSFCGSASPEGSFAVNRELAKERCNTLERYIRDRISIPDSIISRPEGFVAWGSLAELAEKSDMPYKDEALDVLRNVPEFTFDDNGVMTDSRKKHLMDLQYGRTWHYMYDHFFSKIRNASAIIVKVRQVTDSEEVPAVKEEAVPEEVPEMEEEPPLPPPADTAAVAAQTELKELVTPPGISKPFYMSVKTNMLFDLLAVPNIGVEFYLGGNLSLTSDWMYGWWKKDSSHRYWRFYGGDLALRYWFGKAAHEKALTGHHLGLYGQVFTYDFEFGGKGYMGGKPGGSIWDKANYAFGLEYGFSLPIARRLNIDFTAGAGYWGGIYYEYKPIDDCYVWQATKRRQWFGPTKAEVSLIWLIGAENCNKKKGGAK